MTQPETETEDEMMSSGFLGEVRTDTTDAMEDTTIESIDQTSVKYKSTDYETDDDSKKKGFWMSKRYAESETRSGKKNELETAMSDVARFPVERMIPFRECFPLGGFQIQHRAKITPGLDRCGKTRIWRNMRTREKYRQRRTSKLSRRTSETLWPNVWPCLARDAAIGLEIWEKEGRKKRRDIYPCDPSDHDEDEFLLREQKSDFANRKELGHVRVPVSRPESKQLSVDRAVGKRPNLVDGDYVIVELPTKRVYAYVVLHGLKGMHLLEISSLRERRNTWKFCFYQAIVALLAKTQLRYKYTWSANIDYIYDLAWMLFIHIGTINVKTKQRLDDVVVYNYKYSVEVELVQEMKDVVVRGIDVAYRETGLRRQITLSRKDPLEVEVEFGSQKMADSGYMPTHEDVKELEEWLGKVTAQYRDCILRTFRFSLAFWQDGFFWYLYNPYRCDEYGFWEDDGYACIVKFCSADSLRRYLMILLLRGHAYKQSRLGDTSDINDDDEDIHLDVQVFRVTFHRCQLDNLKLLQRGVYKRPGRVDDCPSESLEDQEETDREEDEKDDSRESREKVAWLRRCRMMTWGKCAFADRKRPDSTEITAATKARWHHYYVEEPNRLFSLWGEIHSTDEMFDEANRGMQAYGCYVVCAGMTTITAPEYWSPKTLDAIVVCGDRYYTYSKHEAELKSGEERASNSFKYLSDRFEIGEILFEARMLPAVCGRLYSESNDCLWKTLERVFSDYHFVALTCENACLGLFKFCGAYYMCDVNSYGPPLFQYGHGVAYLLRATSFRKFMMVLILTIGSVERNRFSLNPIEILKIVEMDTALKVRSKTREKRRRFRRLGLGKVPGELPRFALDEQKRKQTKK